MWSCSLHISSHSYWLKFEFRPHSRHVHPHAIYVCDFPAFFLLVSSSLFSPSATSSSWSTRRSWKADLERFKLACTKSFLLISSVFQQQVAEMCEVCEIFPDRTGQPVEGGQSSLSLVFSCCFLLPCFS